MEAAQERVPARLAAERLLPRGAVGPLGRTGSRTGFARLAIPRCEGTSRRRGVFRVSGTTTHMTPKQTERLHAELGERLEAFLAREARDPEAREMLVSLEGD